MSVAEKWKSFLDSVSFIWCHSCNTHESVFTWVARLSHLKSIFVWDPERFMLSWPSTQSELRLTAVFHDHTVRCGLCSGREGTKTLLLRTLLILSSRLLFLLHADEPLKMSSSEDWRGLEQVSVTADWPQSIFLVFKNIADIDCTIFH